MPPMKTASVFLCCLPCSPPPQRNSASNYISALPYQIVYESYDTDNWETHHLLLVSMNEIIRKGAPELTDKFTSELDDRLPQRRRRGAPRSPGRRPFLVVGGCGGRLAIPGQYIRMPDYGQPGHGTIGNFYTSILNAYGDPVEHFGDPDFELERQGLPQCGAVAPLIA